MYCTPLLHLQLYLYPPLLHLQLYSRLLLLTCSSSCAYCCSTCGSSTLLLSCIFIICSSLPLSRTAAHPPLLPFQLLSSAALAAQSSLSMCDHCCCSPAAILLLQLHSKISGCYRYHPQPPPTRYRHYCSCLLNMHCRYHFSCLLHTAPLNCGCLTAHWCSSHRSCLTAHCFSSHRIAAAPVHSVLHIASQMLLHTASSSQLPPARCCVINAAAPWLQAASL